MLNQPRNRQVSHLLIELPGLTIKVIPGPGAVDGDMPYKNLFLASQSRWLLENMATGRGVSERVLPQETLEVELDKLLSIRGEHRFNQFRDACRTLANKIGREKEFKRLDGIMGALLGTHESKKLHGKQALARAAGRPYDPDRLVLFDTLFSGLRAQALPEVTATAETGVARENFAFFLSPTSRTISKALHSWSARPRKSCLKASSYRTGRRTHTTFWVPSRPRCKPLGATNRQARRTTSCIGSRASTRW